MLSLRNENRGALVNNKCVICRLPLLDDDKLDSTFLAHWFCGLETDVLLKERRSRES